MLVFLAVNNITLVYEDTELIATILAVASGTLDAEGLLTWMQQHME